MTGDPRALAELLEESQDLQADAMHSTHDAIDDLVEVSHSSIDDDPASNLAFHEQHQKGLRASLGGCNASGGGRWCRTRRPVGFPAFASSSKDIQVLQTAASIENLQSPPTRRR